VDSISVLNQDEPPNKKSDLQKEDEEPELELELDEVKSDPEYIVNTAKCLLEYIHIDENRYRDFVSKLRKPLGIDTYEFLKALRASDG
jgi:hypothetical protein